MKPELQIEHRRTSIRKPCAYWGCVVRVGDRSQIYCERHRDEQIVLNIETERLREENRRRLAAEVPEYILTHEA